MTKRTQPGRSCAVAAALLAVWPFAASGCLKPFEYPDDDAGTSGPDPDDACAEQADGESCGDGMHCIDERCRENRCGDGIQAGAEACDDGNRQSDDGCSVSCKLEASSSEPRCGNGIIEPENGEVCDGPYIVGPDEDREPGTRLDCSADCSELLENDACTACQESACSDVEGVDLVAACFERVNGEFGADPNDPDLVQQCTDAVRCALRSDCAFEFAGPFACYCGSRSFDDCPISGPAADAPCVEQWEAAARTKARAELWSRASDLAYPVAWADKLLECYRTQCREVCVP